MVAHWTDGNEPVIVRASRYAPVKSKNGGTATEPFVSVLFPKETDAPDDTASYLATLSATGVGVAAFYYLTKDACYLNPDHLTDLRDIYGTVENVKLLHIWPKQIIHAALSLGAAATSYHPIRRFLEWSSRHKAVKNGR